MLPRRKLYRGEKTEQERTDEKALDAIRFIADQVIGDIEGDFSRGVVVSYDLYVDRLVIRTPLWPYGQQTLFGVIDIGELYQGVYTWEEDKWEADARFDPIEIRDRIIEERTGR